MTSALLFWHTSSQYSNSPNASSLIPISIIFRPITVLISFLIIHTPFFINLTCSFITHHSSAFHIFFSPLLTFFSPPFLLFIFFLFLLSFFPILHIVSITQSILKTFPHYLHQYLLYLYLLFMHFHSYSDPHSRFIVFHFFNLASFNLLFPKLIILLFILAYANF